jgi:aspartate/methionine/tyrosine aminotransferase
MFDILDRAAKQEQSGNYVARMEIGDTPGFKNEMIHKLIQDAAANDYRYSASSGEQDLKSAVARTQWPTIDNRNESVSIAPANFLITSALIALTSPGDLVLLPDPGFPTYKLSCEFLGLEIEYYEVSNEGYEKFDVLDVLNRRGKLPSVCILNNPSNPLGFAFPGSEVCDWKNALREHGVRFIADETYVNLVYEAVDAYSTDPTDIRIRSFSKEHCAPGLRVGYALAPNEYSRVMEDFASLTISCVPKFIQSAIAKYLLTDASHIFVSEVRSVMSRRFDYLTAALPTGLISKTPNAAFYALLEVGDGDDAFESLMNQNVSTCPGSKFGKNAKSKLRVSLAGKEANFEQDIEMLVKALQKYLA